MLFSAWYSCTWTDGFGYRYFSSRSAKTTEMGPACYSDKWQIYGIAKSQLNLFAQQRLHLTPQRRFDAEILHSCTSFGSHRGHRLFWLPAALPREYQRSSMLPAEYPPFSSRRHIYNSSSMVAEIGPSLIGENWESWQHMMFSGIIALVQRNTWIIFREFVAIGS